MMETLKLPLTHTHMVPYMGLVLTGPATGGSDKLHIIKFGVINAHYICTYICYILLAKIRLPNIMC